MSHPETRTFARTCIGFNQTNAQYAIALHAFKTPLYKRIIWAFCRWCWVACLVGGAVITHSQFT